MRSELLRIRLTEKELSDLSRRASLDRRTISAYARTLLFPLERNSAPPAPVEKPKRTLHCKQCAHEWIPKVDNPKQCPECKGEWDKTRLEASADAEARFDAEAAAVGISPEEYNRTPFNGDPMNHYRRWARIKKESGISPDTWEIARWLCWLDADIAANLEKKADTENRPLFDVASEIKKFMG
jgi:hypothetical protein